MKGIDMENIYINLKLSSEKIKEKIISKNKKFFKSESKNKKDQIKFLKTMSIFPSLNINYPFQKFSTYINQFYIECPLISSKEENFEIFSNINNKKIEITNKIYDTNQRINYYKLNNKIKIRFELEGDSKFWLFLHCEENFNEKTAIIIISKENYDRNFISFGIFLNKNEYGNNMMNSLDNININNINNINNNNYEFIELKKQELFEENTVKELKEKNKINNEINNNNDDNNEIIDDDNYQTKSLYDLDIIDDGIKILCSVKLNEGGGENNSIGDFFYPVLENIYGENTGTENEFDDVIKLNMNEKDKKNKDNNSINNSGYKIKIAGSGDKCSLISFVNELNLKNQKYEFYNKQADCQCCFIF